MRELFAYGDLMSKRTLRNILRHIFDTEALKLQVGQELKKTHSWQERHFDINSIPLKNIFARLELEHGMVLLFASNLRELIDNKG